MAEPSLECRPWSLLKTLLTSVTAIIAIASCAADQTTPIGVDAGARRSTELATFVKAVGCKRHPGNPAYGTIGFPTPDGWEAYDCKGVTGESMRGAIAQHKASLTDPRFPSVTGGYFIRHFLGEVERCTPDTYVWMFNGRVTGSYTVNSYLSCVTKAYFWDEWIPGEFDDPLPSGGGASPAGYYGPDAAPEKLPRMDTLPDTDEHKCEDDRHSTNDAACSIPLTETDKARINDTLRYFWKHPVEISDSLSYAECSQLRVWFDSATALGYIWRGRTDSVAPGKKKHTSQSFQGGMGSNPMPMHIDPWVLNGANKNSGKMVLVISIAHELAHSWGNSEHSDLESHVNAGYPGDPYFATVASGVCFKFP